MKFSLFILFLSLSSLAEEIRPTPPAGWMEIHSTPPVVLTWTKTDLNRSLKDLPSLMVQKLPLNEKFVSYLKEEKSDQSSCRIIKNEDNKKWSQFWCLKSEAIYILLWKDTDSFSTSPREALKKWILSHE